ncbi:hypothetical protein [Stenotrophomonas sp.]|uniref:hypothetical protein n=1 Tax=Stenotrophomonas sp. TaxID=69392 RepID=UPI001311895C|nr:hypothetical protein [Stenotrophomonas sp.]MBD3774184.1 hypothetical protein [Paracoccaceae bacterium]
MNESVFMQLEMDAGLRARFQQAAACERRPAAQVLQRLMREYVARQAGQSAAGATGAAEPVERAAKAAAIDQYTAGTPELPPHEDSGEQDLEALARRQHGWSACPFGTR